MRGAPSANWVVYVASIPMGVGRP